MRINIMMMCVALMFSSCVQVLSPFTSKVKREANLGDEQLRKIQFYISHDITLRREISGSKTEINSGELKIIDGRQVQEIFIPAGTPGVVVSTDGSDRVGISFETSSDSYLLFGKNSTRGGAYTLLARDWQNGMGKVQYDGITFYTERMSAQAELQLNLKKLNSTNMETRTANGRTVSK